VDDVDGDQQPSEEGQQLGPGPLPAGHHDQEQPGHGDGDPGPGAGTGNPAQVAGHPDGLVADPELGLPAGHDDLGAVGGRLDLGWVGGTHPVGAVVVPGDGVAVADAAPQRRGVGAGVGWRRGGVDAGPVEVGGRGATVLKHPSGADTQIRLAGVAEHHHLPASVVADPQPGAGVNHLHHQPGHPWPG
jgi:hypothetical protein